MSPGTTPISTEPPTRVGSIRGFPPWSSACLLVLLAFSATARASEAPGGGTAARGGDANPDSDDGSSNARVSGSWTARAGFTEGSGNDRHSSRLALEWAAGRFSGGFTAQFESAAAEGVVHHEPGVGSFDLTERWVGWSRHDLPVGIDVRLGHSFGTRFGEGLVLGAASFDGLALTLDPSESVQLVLLAGRTEVLDPEDFFDDPLTLFPPEDEFLGSKGELLGLRTELRPTDRLVVGLNALQARADGTPSAGLASVDLAFSRGMLDLSAELASRDGGGTGAYVRTDLALSDRFALGVEHRRYDDFLTPLGNVPLYSGLSAASETDEEGWLVRLDAVATERVSLAWTFDYSASGDKDDVDEPRVKRDHRLELDWSITDRTALAWGLELEDTAGGRDGVLQSVLVTHAFEGGGRLSGRLQLDASSPEHRTTLRLNYRKPLLERRLTLLVDETLRMEEGSILGTLQLGASVRVGASSFLTMRGTLADGEPNSLDLTWYQRF